MDLDTYDPRLPSVAEVMNAITDLEDTLSRCSAQVDQEAFGEIMHHLREVRTLTVNTKFPLHGTWEGIARILVEQRLNVAQRGFVPETVVDLMSAIDRVQQMIAAKAEASSHHKDEAVSSRLADARNRLFQWQPRWPVLPRVEQKTDIEVNSLDVLRNLHFPHAEVLEVQEEQTTELDVNSLCDRLVYVVETWRKERVENKEEDVQRIVRSAFAKAIDEALLRTGLTKDRITQSDHNAS